MQVDKVPLTMRKLSEDLYQIEGSGAEYAYLLLGTQRAALIDTCAGYGSIKQLVEQVTGLPLLVLNTHGHVDHAGGNYDFDEVYLHKEDWGLARSETTVEHRIWFLQKVAAETGKTVEVHQEWLRPPNNVRVLELEDGMVFPLGEVQLEAIHTPGHTRGCVSFLDRRHKRLFGGDSFHSQVQLFFPYSAPVEVYAQSIQRIQGLSTEFEGIYGGHGAVPLGLGCLEDLEDCCERALTGEPAVILPEGVGLSYPQNAEGQRTDGRIGNLYYRLSN